MEYLNIQDKIMEINELQAFTSVSELASFSLAAEQLHLTQPAVSKRIAALEVELGTRLFDRIGRRVTLTEAGRALLPNALKIIRDIDESRRVIANLSGSVKGRLSMGTSHHIGLHRLPPILRAYTQQYPGVELDIHFMDSEQACSAVEHGDLELGVVTLPAARSEKLLLTKIWDDPLDIVVAPNHPLLKKTPVKFDDLSQHPAILPAVGTFTRDIIMNVFTAKNLQLKVALETNYLETIKVMVSIGLGWSALPRTMLDHELRALCFNLPHLSRQLGIVQHRMRTLSNAADALLEILKNNSTQH